WGPGLGREITLKCRSYKKGNCVMDNPFKPQASLPPATEKKEPVRAQQPIRWKIVITQFFLASGILAFIFLLPWTLEWFSYRMARGRVRATHETLNAFSPTSFGNTSRLVAEAIKESVVNITTQTSNPTRRRLAEGQGSGVIVAGDGYILTNHHVIEDAENCLVTLHNNRQLPAVIIGADPTTDIAVLKIDHLMLHPATWGDSEGLAAGDPVWAIGSPYGLENSVSFGIVSATSRDGIGRGGYDDLLQTDAALNPGNSGGPLVNAKGHLIGINMAIVGPSHRGISFAIPSNKARMIYEQIKARGGVERGWLGVQLQTIPIAIRSEVPEGGVLLSAILEGSPAEKSGLKIGDIILALDGERIVSPRDLSKRVSAARPGTVVTLETLRGGEQLTLPVTLAQKPMAW
ncbi:MAG: trypsin-like peptidase domain-containing protein, partial [Planctomycetota bacterium]|nr:trypsin-like peptidase domain-containing protein [Planctomycetota bacterium]